MSTLALEAISDAVTAPAPVTPPRNYLSYSAISTYRQCPLRYYFRYIAGLPERAVSASLVFGSAIHAAVEHHFRELMVGNPPPELDALLAAYAGEWRLRQDDEINYGKGDDRAGLDRLADRMLTAFQRSELATPQGAILGIEETLRGPILPGLPDVLGRLDLLFDAGDAYVVTDLKTSKTRWSAEQVEDAGEQLLLYSDLVSEAIPGKPVRLQFAVITKTKEPVIDRHEVPNTPGRRDRTKRIVERVWQAIESEHFFPSPSPMNCPSCPFREPCRAWPG